MLLGSQTSAKMVTYKLTINVADNWVKQLNNAGMKLCFAIAAEAGGSSKYNVVAYADSTFPTYNHLAALV